MVINEKKNENGVIRCLLVDDDNEGGFAMKNGLDAVGVATTLVESAEEAVAVFHPDTFDIVLADIRLKKMSGVDLLEYLRTEYPAFPVILVTAYEELDTAIQAVRLGAQDYIIKPVDSFDNITFPVEKAVRNHRLYLQKCSLEKMLGESEKKLREVIENSRDIVFRLNWATRTFDYLSPSLTAVLGQPREYFQSRPISGLLDLVHQDDVPRVQGLVLKVAEGRPESIQEFLAHAMDLRIKDAANGFRWLSFTGNLVFGANHEPAAVVGCARDVTDDKARAEEEAYLRDKLNRLEKMQSLSLLAAGMAHDLKNLLFTSRVIPDLLIRNYKQDKEIKDGEKFMSDLAMIMNSVKEAGNLIQDLVTIGGVSQYALTPLDLNVMVKDYIEMSGRYRVEATRGAVRLQADICAQPLPIRGAPLYLSRVLMNLVGNACDAMSDKGVLAIKTALETLSVQSKGYEVVPKGRYCVLSVRDTGTGMEKDILEKKIFEPFFTTKTRTRKETGCGLGLSIVRAIVRDHGGYIDVKSVPGKGTEFILYFPEAGEEQMAGPTTSDGAIPSGLSVLLVDDDLKELVSREKMLMALGCGVVTAKSGREAVELFQKKLATENTLKTPFSLVMLDVNMEPDFDGYETYRQVAFSCPEQRCVLTSAFPKIDKVKEAETLGIIECVSKPQTLDELTTMIQRVLFT